ncbi:MAG: hypothetical protein FRX48_03840 [Lasallia pustulata]|uniref:Uncharacterized protein n=1 Tax=Lasallia pustulata TaxID=136370 RepID=A0A5M8PUZ2_9LECA|nr:MAG: hypothetical protein FRX48_03840 [Lasallia pustulata]
MSDISVPKTPTPEPVRRSDQSTPMREPTPGHADATSKQDTRYFSPPPPPSDLTPPPSSQIPRQSAREMHQEMADHREASITSPPATVELPSIGAFGASAELPSSEEIAELPEQSLRELVAGLLPALSEARMSAAHFRLQHSLLSIETSEYAKRAAVEHELTRREVEVLQTGPQAYRGASAYATPEQKSPHDTSHRHLELALSHCRELEADNAVLEQRLRQANKIIKHLDAKNVQLLEDNQLLRQRIKQNREHLNSMRTSGALSVNGTPRIDYSTPHIKQTPRISGSTRSIQPGSNRVGGQDPLDALLAAGQALNGEANSVPSTPTHPRSLKPHPAHNRGTHSLSSLPTTPNRPRPLTADNTPFTPITHSNLNERLSYSTPNTQYPYEDRERAREDRDSTISASDHEDETYTEEEVPESQATQAATSMLRRTPVVSAGGRTSAKKAFVQGKLFGQVKKYGTEGHERLKRPSGAVGADFDGSGSKKVRLEESMGQRIGLGIDGFASPKH